MSLKNLSRFSNDLSRKKTLFHLAEYLLQAACSHFLPWDIGQSGTTKSTVAIPTTNLLSPRAAIQYRTALLELKKSQRVLRVMADGYLTAKALPESELGDFYEFLSSIDQLTNENFALDEATALFVAGDRTAAKNLIQKEIANLNRLQEKVTERTKAFQSKTYQ